MFKRRNPLTYWEWFVEGVYPRAGWRRVLYYIRHRLQRLPDTPHRICLGLAIGIFVCFTPLFGLHILSAILLSIILRGNVVASVIGTFFGNPLTFPLIAGFSYRLGWFLLGRGNEAAVWDTVRHGFSEIFHDIWINFLAIFTHAEADWAGVQDFWTSVFLPYTIGGAMPGFVIAVLFYLGMRPLVTAYQRRRRGRLLAKLKEIRAKKQSEADVS